MVLETNGDTRTTLYNAEGMRESVTFVDMSDSRSWDRYTNTYDGETGKMSAQELLFDNGNTRSSTYLDGVLSSRVTLETDGDTKTTLYDANGMRESFTFVDTSDARSWDRFTNTYDGETGKISAQELLFDNGNTRSSTYLDGVLSSRIDREVDGDTITTSYDASGMRQTSVFEDVSESRSWAQYTNTYNENGELVSREYIFDVA
jgi:hypothetical protein